MKKRSPISRLSSPSAKIQIHQSYGKGIKTKFSATQFLKILKEIYRTKPTSKKKIYSVELHWVKSLEMKKFNKQFRNIDKATDVLSFESESSNSLGSIIIDLDTAKKQAKDYNHSTRREVQELFVHGVFHLLGFDHQNKKDEKIMKAHERKLEKFLDRLDHPKR